MSDIIRLLPDSVANQIAAGEVIQRPASVVKELVENAVDAGATSIQIIIKDAGRTLIQVVDNGSGMSDTDARMAFERHATSKIEAAADLFALHTMGFRGEALASIAAVAQVDLRTMQRDAAIGTRLVINGSRVERQEPEACVPGTNMMVKNLFFNVPARRKFLKKDSVELANIMREFERLALVNPNHEFTLIHNDAVLHQLLRGSQKQRIVDLFGKALDKQLIPVETDTSLVRLSGFVGLPEHARKRNALQYFFVNGRNMRHPYFHKAVMQCYEELIPADEQPNYFIGLEVDPESIDVNIHPTKSEIKFEDEPAIWQIIKAAVKEALGRYNAVPGIDFDVDDAPEIPVFDPDATAEHGVDLDPAYNPFASAAPAAPAPRQTAFSRQAMTQDWEKLYDDFTRKRDSAEAEVRGSALNTMAAAEVADEAGREPTLMGESVADVSAPGCFQLKNRYIITQSRDGMLIVDRHRAHVRILFDRYMALAAEHRLSVQRVMFPETVTLSPSQNAVLAGMTDEIEAMGFDVAFLGDNTWSINGIPSVIGDLNPVDTLLGMIESVTEGGDAGGKMRERMALAMARSSAIKSGQSISAEEADRLLGELFRLPEPSYTPDGLRVIHKLPMEEIAGMLG